MVWLGMTLVWLGMTVKHWDMSRKMWMAQYGSFIKGWTSISPGMVIPPLGMKIAIVRNPSYLWVDPYPLYRSSMENVAVSADRGRFTTHDVARGLSHEILGMKNLTLPDQKTWDIIDASIHNGKNILEKYVLFGFPVGCLETSHVYHVFFPFPCHWQLRHCDSIEKPHFFWWNKVDLKQFLELSPFFRMAGWHSIVTFPLHFQHVPMFDWLQNCTPVNHIPFCLANSRHFVGLEKSGGFMMQATVAVSWWRALSTFRAPLLVSRQWVNSCAPTPPWFWRYFSLKFLVDSASTERLFVHHPGWHLFLLNIAPLTVRIARKASSESSLLSKASQLLLLMQPVVDVLLWHHQITLW